MTQVGEGVAVTTIADEEVDDLHYAGVEIIYPNGEPYQDYVSVSPTIDGNESSGVLNFEGICWVTMLDPGTAVDYEIGEDVDDELDELREEIKTTLNGIIEVERTQQKRDDTLLAEENPLMQGLILTGAFMSGVGDGAVGMFEFAADAVELGGKALWMNVQAQGNVMEAAWEKYAQGDHKGYFESLNEKNVEDFAKIFGVTPKEIALQMLQAYEILAFVMEDNETKGMLLTFAKDYVLAQSKVEAATMVGSAAFDIILAAILAATTGGAGNAAQVLAKVRHAGRFKALALRLKNFVKLAKKKKLRKSVKGKLDGKVKVEVEAPPATKIETKKVEDKDFKKKDKDTNKDSDSEKNKEESSGAGANASTSKSDTSTSENGKNKSGETCSSDSKTCTGGEPISLVTGEEILPLVDFTMDGPFPLVWERKYKSSNPDNIGLGHGWTHPFAYRLVVSSEGLQLHDCEARIIPFSIPAIGRSSHNVAEKLSLKRVSQSAYILTDNASYIERHFDALHSSETLSLSRVQDNVGNLYRLYYHQGYLDRIQSGPGDTWDFSYDKGNISSINWTLVSGKNKTQVQYLYDDKNDLAAAKDAAGHSEYYEYKNHLISKRTLKSGYSFYFEWDGSTSNSRCVRNWGDSINGVPTYDYTFKWDRKSKSVDVTDTRGGVTTHQFNDRGLPVYIRDPEGGQTYYHYDNLGNLTREVDAQGNAQHYSYNSQQQLQAFTNKRGQKSSFSWDNQGNQVLVKDALEQNWKSEYNKKNQLVTRTNPLGESYSYQYNELGLTSRVTDPEGKSWQYLWDNQARLTAIRNPLGHNTRYSYNSLGEMIRTTWPDGQSTQYRYDSTGNCIAVKSADGKVQNYGYNSLGLLNQHLDSNGRKTVYEYNGLSQVVRRTDPSGQRLDYHYDGERNLIGLTNEKGERYHLKYDLNERLIEEIGFDGRVQRYTYNNLGHLVSSCDYSADGKELLNEIVYQRDIQGRLLRQNDGKTGKRLNEFSYDPLGRLEQARNGHSHLQWKYDSVGRVVEDHQGDQILKHSYSPGGQRIASLLPNGDKLQYGFDDAGAFKSLDYNCETVADITRDLMGREVQRQLGNQLVTDQGYDPQGRLLKQTTYKKSGDVEGQSPKLSERDYHYNAEGQLSQIDDKKRGSTRYHYDKLDRLTQVQGPAPERFVHDPAGNILSVLGGGDEASDVPSSLHHQVKGNRLAFQGDVHFKYDELGNRIAQGRGKNQSIRSFYRYNALNQLTDVKSDKLHMQYAYDPLGRRIAKADSESRTNFLWMEDVLLSETTQAQEQNAEQNKAKNTPNEKLYLFEPGTFKPLAMVQNKSVYHYHLDHLGTPQEITDAKGKVVWAVSYKAYGSLALAYESEVENNIRFQGQYFDEESGLHYNRFRYYDPSAGRFINQDPIGLLGGMNNYQYAPNPIGWVDPYGLTAKQGDCGGGEKKVNLSAVSADDVANAVKSIEAKGLHFGQDFIYQKGTSKMNIKSGGVQEKVNDLLDPDGTLNWPMVGSNDVIVEGHHTIVAMELTGYLDRDLISSIKGETLEMLKRDGGNPDTWIHGNGAIKTPSAKVKVKGEDGRVIRLAGD